MSDLIALAERVEAAQGADAALNREVALAVGWHRYSPSEIGRKSAGWIAPEDFIGEYSGKDGRRSPMLDSLHGTEIWREPRPYLTSLDAAMQLVPEGREWELSFCLRDPRFPPYQARICIETPEEDPDEEGPQGVSNAATPALALTAAALRAARFRAAIHGEAGNV